jgi:dipeptidyl aminopeptidase/acylaminoacyl peptidase
MQTPASGGRAWLSRMALALMMAFMATAAIAQAADPLPVERFFQRPAVLEAKLSPSGRQLALTTARGAKRVSLVVVSLGSPPAVKRIVQFSDADVLRFDWVGDERLVFSVQDLASGSGEDRRLAPGLFAVNADGSELLSLVRRQGKAFVTDGSRQDRALDWNHQLLQVPLPQDGVRPDEVVIGRFDGKHKDLESVTPMWLNVRSGRTRAMDLLSAPRGTLHWLFDSQGRPQVAVSQQAGRQVIYWHGAADTGWRKLADSPLLQSPFKPYGVDDKGTLYVVHPQGGAGDSVLARYDFDAMAVEQEALVSAPGFDFSGSLILDQAGGRALGVRVDTDAEQTVWFDAAMKQFQASADARMPGHVNRISCRRCAAPDMTALVRSYSDQDPGRLWIYEAGGQRWTAVSTVMEGIDARHMATVDFQRIKARDGSDLPVWLTLPAGRVEGQALPTIVMVHGGPWLRGSHWRWEPMAQFLASRGYLVIAPEFRGSTGYGLAHYKAGWKQWGQAMQDDIADALLWAQSKGLADKHRACIAGASYGGYATLMGLVRQPELYRCGVAWVAVTDPLLLLKGSWWIDDDANAQGREFLLPELIGNAEKDLAMLTANSPLAQAARIKAPLLLGVGESDRRVPPAHGERLREAMRAAGNPPEWVSYADEGHSWRLVATQVDWARRVERFLAQHLKAETP